MSSKTVRNIFIFFMIWLPVQYGLAGILGVIHREPWPAFTFPGFKNVYVYQDLYQIPQTYIEVYNIQGKKTGTYKPYQFFPDLPRSQISGFVRTHFPDERSIESLPEGTKKWLKNQSGQLTGGDADQINIISTVEFYRRTDTGLEVNSTSHQFTAVILLNDL